MVPRCPPPRFPPLRLAYYALIKIAPLVVLRSLCVLKIIDLLLQAKMVWLVLAHPVCRPNPTLIAQINSLLR